MNAVQSVDDYVANQPEELRATLEELRRTIKAAAPEAEEVISYQIPTYKYRGPLVAFGAAKNHYGFYVMSKAIMEAHKDELTPYSKAATTIRFPVGEPLPAALVTKIVQERIKENEASRKK